jgi:EAL domain-containing protein (putative c-di-GMP-specific phosphodiesterase class I)
VDEPEKALSIVEELRAMGVGIKIDDFGTGYSSLSYLHRLPFDSLKIDKSFINSMTKDHTAFEIVRAIVSLADNLGLHVVAEGIEHRSQAEELRNLGCQFGQGYLFAPPLTATAAERMLDRQNTSLLSA